MAGTCIGFLGMNRPLNLIIIIIYIPGNGDRYRSDVVVGIKIIVTCGRKESMHQTLGLTQGSLYCQGFHLRLNTIIVPSVNTAMIEIATLL